MFFIPVRNVIGGRNIGIYRPVTRPFCGGFVSTGFGTFGWGSRGRVPVDSTVAENASQNRDFLVLWGGGGFEVSPRTLPSYGPAICSNQRRPSTSNGKSQRSCQLIEPWNIRKPPPLNFSQSQWCQRGRKVQRQGQGRGWWDLTYHWM